MCIGIIMIVDARSHVRLHLKRERHRRRYTKRIRIYKDECTVRVVIRILLLAATFDTVRFVRAWYNGVYDRLQKVRSAKINGCEKKDL